MLFLTMVLPQPALLIRWNYSTYIFSSIFRPQLTTNFNTSYLNIQDQSFVWPLLSEPTILVDEVAKCLMDLDITKACAPKGIPARLLKEFANEIAPSLCLTFNTSLRTACLPKEWKEANVTPVHKKDSKELASNYRPLSLLCLVNKVLQRCIGNSLYRHIINVIPHYNMVSCKIALVFLSYCQFYILLEKISTTFKRTSCIWTLPKRLTLWTTPFSLRSLRDVE